MNFLYEIQRSANVSIGLAIAGYLYFMEDAVYVESSTVDLWD